MITQAAVTQQLIIDEAIRRGWKVHNQHGKHYDIVDAKGAVMHFFLSRPAISTTDGVKLAIDKLQTMRAIEGLGYQVAPFSEYGNPRQAKAFLEKYAPIAVKPNDGEQSRGVMVSIRTSDELAAAYRTAMAHSKQARVILQGQLVGHEYRLLVVGDTFFAASYRRPAQVVGDGVSTVTALIEQENVRRHRQESGLEPIDLQRAKEYLGTSGLHKILALGSVQRLSDIGSMSAGGDTIDVTDDVHESYKDMAVTVAQKFGLAICGFDILTNDITATPKDFLPLLEINSAPGFKPHVYIREGKVRNPAPVLLDYVFERVGGSHEGKI